MDPQLISIGWRKNWAKVNVMNACIGSWLVSSTLLSIKISLTKIHAWRHVSQLYHAIVGNLSFSSLAITWTRSVQHFNFTPTVLSNYLIFRTNFRFPRRFENSECPYKKLFFQPLNEETVNSSVEFGWSKLLKRTKRTFIAKFVKAT